MDICIKCDDETRMPMELEGKWHCPHCYDIAKDVLPPHEDCRKCAIIKKRERLETPFYFQELDADIIDSIRAIGGPSSVNPINMLLIQLIREIKKLKFEMIK